MIKKIKRIVYAASTMDENSFAELFKDSPFMPGQQAQKYNRLLQQGIAMNGVEVVAISTPPVTMKNSKKRIVKVKNRVEKDVSYRYVPVVNVSRLKNLIFILSTFLKSLYLLNNESVAVCDVLNVSASIGIVAASKVRKRPVIGIVTDIPELMVTGHSRKQVELCHSIIKKCNGYVFLTEGMNIRLNKSNKPYSIIEGISDDTLPCVEERNDGKTRKCLYAGLLDTEYGVKNMVDGFLKANIINTELHICGSGPYESELKEIVHMNKNIVFHGRVLNSEVVRLEKECNLLINPRPSTCEFTKFSFPSKIMEYMSSGTATMATRLEGIPTEYYDFLLPIEDETSDGMEQSFKKYLSVPDAQLHEIGKRAQQWINLDKNRRKQGERLISICNQVI